MRSRSVRRLRRARRCGRRRVLLVRRRTPAAAPARRQPPRPRRHARRRRPQRAARRRHRARRTAAGRAAAATGAAPARRPQPAARRTRHAAAAAAAAAGRDAEAGRRRSSRRPRRRPIRASASRPAGGTPAQAAWNMTHDLDDAADRKGAAARRTRISRSPASTRSRATTTASTSTTSRIPRSRCSRRAISARRRRTTCRSTRTCCSCRPKSTNSRADCGFGGVPDPVSKDARARHPHLRHRRHQASEAGDDRADLPRLAHAHRRDAAGRQRQRLHLRSGTAGVRSADELPGCADGGIDDPNTARFRLEVIKVPLAAPEKAAIVSSPRIFNGSAGRRRAIADRDAHRTPRRAPARRCGARPLRGAAARRAPAAARRRGRRPRRRGRRGRRPARISATTSPCIRRSASPAARARASACCSTSATRRIPVRLDCGGRRQHVVLALGDVQQRRQEDPVHRRVGRRLGSRAAAPPTRWSGAPTRSSPSRTTS